MSKILRITSQTLRSWVHKFAEGGVSNLENKPGAGRKSTIKEEHLKQIEKWIKEDGQLTLAAIQIKLQEEYALQTSYVSVHRSLNKLKFSYITPRPKHYKQNTDQLDELKKICRLPWQSILRKSSVFSTRHGLEHTQNQVMSGLKQVLEPRH